MQLSEYVNPSNIQMVMYECKCWSIVLAMDLCQFVILSKFYTYIKKSAKCLKIFNLESFVNSFIIVY